MTVSSRKNGGADRDRTDDLRLAKPALSQLSYSPENACRLELVGLDGFEPSTSRLSGGRSNQLSYRPYLSTFLDFIDDRFADSTVHRDGELRIGLIG